MIGPLLAFVFPPRVSALGQIRASEIQIAGPAEVEHLGDGIIWRGYDVRMTGIERQALREREVVLR